MEMADNWLGWYLSHLCPCR